MSETVAVCDTLIIGAGSAGIEAYKAATAQGAHCILVEAGPFGSGSRRTGDAPALALMEAAKVAHACSCAHTYGLEMAPQYNTDHVLMTVRSVRAKETSEVLSFIYALPEECRLVGKARFINEHCVQVNDLTQVRFTTAVIATGSTSVIPFDLSQYRVHGGIYTPGEIFELDTLPRSIAVLGCSRHGLQLAQALNALGSRVVIFGTRQLWKLTDDTVIDAAIEIFKKRFNLQLDCYTTAIERTESGFGLYYLDSRAYENFLSVENILSANTCLPKIDGLNLREFGITMNRMGGITVDPETMQTAVPHLFAAGEVVDPLMSITEAKAAGRLAGYNASCLQAGQQQKQQRVRLDVLYTDPELAVVGLSHEEVKSRARHGQGFLSCEVRAERASFRLTQKTGGLLRIYCDEISHAIIGAEMCLEGASHIAHYLALVIGQKMPVEQISQQSFFVPSYEEIVLEACKIAQKIFARKQNS